MGVRAGEVHRLVAIVPPHAVGRLLVGPQHFEHDTAAAAQVQRCGLDRDAIACLSAHLASLHGLGRSDPAAPFARRRAGTGPDSRDLGDEPKQSSKTVRRWCLRPAGRPGAEQAVFEVLEPESARQHRSGHERGQEQDGHDGHTRVRSRCRLICPRLSEVPPGCGSSRGDAELFWIFRVEFDPGPEWRRGVTFPDP